MNQLDERTPFLTRMVELFLRGDVAILVTLVSLALGLAALWLTPREEEPQIVVPLADVMISAPGLSAEDVERKVTTRVEKLLYQIDGVEYVYSMSRAGQSVVTVRFFVGQDREDSLVKLYNKIQSNVDQIPPAVSAWVVKPIEVDDVPIVNVTLWSSRPDLYDDFHLHRMAAELQNELQTIRDTNRVWVTGGRQRRIRVELDPVRLAARQTSALQVARALQASNVEMRAGAFDQQNREVLVDAGTFVADPRELEDLVVNLFANRPVYLRDVAAVLDGPEELESYTWMGFGPAAKNPAGAKETSPVAQARLEPLPAPGQLFPAVHIAVAKRKGSNAVWVAEAVERKMHELAQTHLPTGVFFRITRDYGETANHKVNELVQSLVIAVVTVIALIGLMIGWRAALIVALAIPVCYSLTMFVNLMVGYTINRVTLFALILSLGLLVDDPITDVENIARYFAMRILPPRQALLRAIQEVRPVLIMSTLAIIASFLPLMFITGMMGPYMAPMALNVPLTVTFSTLVTFILTPWLALVALRKVNDSPTGQDEPFDLTKRPLYRISRALLGPVLNRTWLSLSALGLVGLLFAAAVTLPALRVVPLKMLPYDNKDEFQVVIDMPEGTTLQQTQAAAMRLGDYLAGVPEVVDYQIYVGLASPMDFNGMVRHYFLRTGSNVADIRINLAPKKQRAQQSHTILLRIRNDLVALAAEAGARVKLVEVPPGPPVLATITAEVYGPDGGAYQGVIEAARRVETRLAREPGVVDVDTSAAVEPQRLVFVTDKPKAALSGVSTQAISETLQLALGGMRATVLQLPSEVEPLWIELRLPRSIRSSAADLEEIYMVGEQGQLVQLGALGEFLETTEPPTIFRKNLRRVVFVYGDVAGRPPVDAILDMHFDQQPDGSDPQPAATIRPLAERTWFSPGGRDPWALPVGYSVVWTGEGEWKITLDVFRDLGIAFGAALLLIFVLLMFQTGSRMLPLVIMLAIPLTMIGIMPGFWLLNALVNVPAGGYPDPMFFTATAMIGMIALAGIVVRNSSVLIEFIQMAVREGTPLREAVIQSVAVRSRPILATAGTTLLGNWVITLDPIFSGLAWAIMFGILTSTVFTLVVIPIVYWLLFRDRD
jgi:multidrug efflux pump subunit AcrB